MRVLAVETATRRQSVALVDGEQVLARADRDAKGSHARWLVPTIHELLGASGLALRDLQGLSVSIGPGSFTGLRVGLATMVAFRCATGLPLAAVPTLDALAWNLRGTSSTICSVLKARSGETYWALYRWSEVEELEQLSEARVGPIRELAESLSGAEVLVGDDLETYRREITQYLGRGACQLCEGPSEAMAASAVSVARAGRTRLLRGVVAPLGLSPLYVQRAEAEVKWEQGIHARRTKRARSSQRTSRRAS